MSLGIGKLLTTAVFFYSDLYDRLPITCQDVKLHDIFINLILKNVIYETYKSGRGVLKTKQCFIKFELAIFRNERLIFFR